MNLNLHWHKSIALGKFPYQLDLDEVPASPGVYVFFRVHGNSMEALYVGKAINLKSRIKQQLNNLKLMNGIKSSANGERRLVFAKFIPRPSQKSDNSIGICEKALIRYYLSRGHELINIAGTKIKHHEIISNRNELKKFIPMTTKILVK